MEAYVDAALVGTASRRDLLGSRVLPAMSRDPRICVRRARPGPRTQKYCHPVAPISIVRTSAIDGAIDQRWPVAGAAAASPVADLVGGLVDGGFDPASAQQVPVGFRAVGLVGQDPVRAAAWATRPTAGYPDTVQHGRELGAVTGLAGNQQYRQWFLSWFAGQMQFRGQATARRTGGRCPGAEARRHLV